jgi:integrase
MQGIDAWMAAAGIDKGRLLGSVSKSGKVNRDSLSDWAVWSVVEQSSKQIGIERFGAHDLRRTCAKLCRKNGGDLEQIKFLLGHSSIQTTERYLGSEQDIEIAVNDNLDCSCRRKSLAYLMGRCIYGLCRVEGFW